MGLREKTGVLKRGKVRFFPLYLTLSGRRLPENQEKPGGAGIPPVQGHRLKTCATELKNFSQQPRCRGGHCPPFDWMRSQAELGGKAGSWRKTGNQTRIDAQGGMRFAFPPYGPPGAGTTGILPVGTPSPTKKLFKTAPHGPAAHPQSMKRPAFLTLDPGLFLTDTPEANPHETS
jgi:hypothetical protein